MDVIEHPNSNNRDLLYIDIYPSLIFDGRINYSRVLATIAHEFQHLIHANYEGEELQNIFINEGLSELAEVLSGYDTRNPDGYFNSTNRPLLSWNYESPIPDYTRASLFFTYLFEQMGFEKTVDLVTTQKVGLNALEELINRHHNITFDNLFSDWGTALMLNEASLDSKYGYQHPFFSKFKLESATTAQFPFGSNIIGNAYAHQFLYFPLAKELNVEIDQSNIGVSAVVVLPTGEEQLLNNEQSRFNISDYEHASILLNTSQFNNKDAVSLLISGEDSYAFRELKFDDNIPDPFLGNASYLLLDDFDTQIALSFPINETSWLSEFSIKVVFKSELAGSNVEPETDRDLYYQFFKVKNGKPNTPVTEEIYHTFTRPFGNLRFERIPLNTSYDLLSSVKDSIAIVISNDEDDVNYFAVGLENASRNLASYTNNQNWKNFDENLVSKVDLTGWVPYIRLGTVVNKQNKIIPANDIKTELYGNEVVVTIDSNQDISTEQSSVIARMPSGQIIDSEFRRQTEEEKLSARFPVEVDGGYHFNVHLVNESGLESYQATLDWEIPETADFMLGNNYPNPFNPSTTIPFLLIEGGDVSVEVFDLLGRKVLSKQAQQFIAGQQTLSLEFSGLASGMYLIRMKVERPDGRGAVTRTLKVMLLK